MRTIDDYKDHMLRVANCRKSYIIFYVDDGLFHYNKYIPLRCKSNYCKFCRKINLKLLRKSLVEGLKSHQWRLATLTFPDHSEDRIKVIKSIAFKFRTLILKLKKKYGKFSYVRTIEIHKSGFPHIHAIFSRFIKLSDIKSIWSSLGGGIVDIRFSLKCVKHKVVNCSECFPVPDKSKSFLAAHYLTCELEKSSQDPYSLGPDWYIANVRQFSTSRDIVLNKPHQELKYFGIACCENNLLSQLSDLLDIYGVKKDGEIFIAGEGIKSNFEPLDIKLRYTCHCNDYYL